jgi:hypothetical protein
LSSSNPPQTIFFAFNNWIVITVSWTLFLITC